MIGFRRRLLMAAGEEEIFLVGGRIFYVYNDNGATYKFYDSSMNLLTTQTVAGLANATYYKKKGNASTDKFFVYSTISTNYVQGTFNTQSFPSGTPETSPVFALGYGRQYTAYWYSQGTRGTVFSELTSFNNNKPGGYNDWYIPCRGELHQLWQSGLIGAPQSSIPWTYGVVSSTTSMGVLALTMDDAVGWEVAYANRSRRAYPIRSF